MKNSIASGPIGVFDSGIGGLTVAHAIKELLPDEQLIYFGDTAHLPYGDKSTAAIQAYSIKITDLLIQKGCKVIVIACNSASAAAYELLQEYAATRAKIINVVDTMIDLVSENRQGRSIGVIGTRRTIATNIYHEEIKKSIPEAEVVQLATPLLVPMIEEGFINNKISHDVLSKYLGIEQFETIDQLILGCTHYPLIKNEIEQYFHGRVEVLDSSITTARHLATYLYEAGLMNNMKDVQPDEFYVSDLTEQFARSAKFFFGEPVILKQHRLWE